MKKIILALILTAFIGVGSVFAQENDSSADRKAPNVVLTADQISCVKTAITKREDALISGHSAYATSIASTYTARKTALLSAWDKTIPAERKTAVRIADKNFKDSVRVTRKSWNDARRSAWKTFETDKKTCKVAIGSSETGSAKEDAGL